MNEAVVASLLCPLINQNPSLVFYDLTAIGVTGLSKRPGDARKSGTAKEGLIERQFMLGAAHTSKCMPIDQDLRGSQAKEPTLLPTFRGVLDRNSGSAVAYPYTRAIRDGSGWRF